jgi:hypothetical protein
VITALALAALTHARFLFELDGAPVGTVQLSLDGARYTYVSTHAYRREQAERSETFALDAGAPLPESYWLWKRPPLGCVDGIAELSHERGALCANSQDGRAVLGTVFGRAFTASYDGEGQLTELKLGKSRFLRTERPLVAGKPFSGGFPITGAGRRLALEPAVPGTRWPANAPRGTRTEPVPAADSCFELSRALIATKPGQLELVLGLVVEGERAWPHAWARGADGELDPTARRSSSVEPNRAYLALPAGRAGALYLDLLEGRRRLVWTK